jgi:cardiolipin hydrolase
MKELENALLETFVDHRLSKEEKYELRDLLQAYSNDSSTLSFVRNTAFDLVAARLREQNGFDPEAFKWLEHIVKLIDTVRNANQVNYPTEVYFSPGTQCKRKIISLLNGANATLDVCVFTISDDDISQALYAAHCRQVGVRVISDNDKANDRGSDIEKLIDQGVSVVKDRTSNHMHHKFALIDQRYVINGSFNWTRSASKYNNENITVDSTPEVAVSFGQKFEQLWLEFGGSNH